jgi:hypothetical protein
MTGHLYINKITQELQQAYAAQSRGKAGRARVCARRAAGWAIEEHLRRRGMILDTPSALDHINYLLTNQNISPEIQKVLQHLIQRVAKDSPEEDSYWPLPDVNLVEESHWLAEELLGISIDIRS